MEKLMYRFFVDSKDVTDEEVRITGSDVNHIKNVLRMKNGDKIYVSDGDITDVTCEITEINDDEVIAKIIEEPYIIIKRQTQKTSCYQFRRSSSPVFYRSSSARRPCAAARRCRRRSS